MEDRKELISKAQKALQAAKDIKKPTIYLPVTASQWRIEMDAEIAARKPRVVKVTTTQRILELTKDGNRPHEIAEELQIDVKRVYSAQSNERRRRNGN